jgi:hypothetical protein
MAETLPLQAPRPARPSTPGANQSLKVIIAFALVYVFWGSTYLAIGMTSAAGIPPFVMCAVRFAIAGPLMLAACALFGRRVRIARPEAVRLAAVGGLLLVDGNGGLAWAEQYVPTGFAALIVAVTPIWFLVLETFVFHGDRISRRGLIGLCARYLWDRHSRVAEDYSSRHNRSDAADRLSQSALLVIQLGGRIGALSQVANEG